MRHYLPLLFVILLLSNCKTKQQISTTATTTASDTISIAVNGDTLTINEKKFIGHIPLLAAGNELAVFKDIEQAIGIKPNRIDGDKGYKAYSYDNLGISIDIYTDPYTLRLLSVYFREGIAHEGPKKSFKKRIYLSGVRMDENFTLDDMSLLQPYIKETITHENSDGTALSVEFTDGYDLHIDFNKSGELIGFDIFINYIRIG